jgi:hypothetical protein
VRNLRAEAYASIALHLQATGLKFEAEATGWLQNHSIPLTDDAPKYGSSDVEATCLALLSPGGFVDSTEALEAGSPLGVVVDKTSFYAESGGQVGRLRDSGLVVEMGVSGWCRWDWLCTGVKLVVCQGFCPFEFVGITVLNVGFLKKERRTLCT